MLQRSPNREWAGDMPRVRKTDASRRTMCEFLDGDAAKRYYEELANRDRASTIAKIAEASGMDATEAERAFMHLFVEELDHTDETWYQLYACKLISCLDRQMSVNGALLESGTYMWY